MTQPDGISDTQESTLAQQSKAVGKQHVRALLG